MIGSHGVLPRVLKAFDVMGVHSKRAVSGLASLQDPLTVEIPPITAALIRAQRVPYNISEVMYSDAIQAELAHRFSALLKSSVPELEFATSCLKSGDVKVVLIKNFPVDPILGDFSLDEKRSVRGLSCEGVMLGLSRMLSTSLMSNLNEQNGRIIHDVSPVSGKEGDVSSKGREPFYFHTENPFLSDPPDFLNLFCLEEDPHSGTSFCYVKDLFESLDDSDSESLHDLDFEFISGSGLDASHRLVSPIVDDDGRVRLYEEVDRFKSLDDRGEALQKKLQASFSRLRSEHKSFTISLKSGEMVLFNNKDGVLHGRSGRIQNPNRWLLRSFMKSIE